MNFTMVDSLKELAGGTATLFAWDGTNFVRVTTNVLKPDGFASRRDRARCSGKGLCSVDARQAVYGSLSIFSGHRTPQAMCPCWAPRASLSVLGAPGNRLDSINALGKNIEEASILDHGFIALLKPSGAEVFS